MGKGKKGKGEKKTKKKVEKVEKKVKAKKSKVKAREKFEPKYLPSSSRVDARFLAYRSAAITSTSIDDHQFLNFTVTVGSDAYKGHINIKGGYALAHVTIAYGGRKTNYYYLVTDAGTIADPPGALVSGGATEKSFSEMDSDIKTPILAMLRHIYG